VAENWNCPADYSRSLHNRVSKEKCVKRFLTYVGRFQHVKRALLYVNMREIGVSKQSLVVKHAMSIDSESCKTVYRVGLHRKALCTSKLDLIIAENRNYPTIFRQSLMIVYVIGGGTDATFASRVLHWKIDFHLYLF
jgi:hypothetical protein